MTKPLSYKAQLELEKYNMKQGKLCERCKKKETYLHVDWCPDCIYVFSQEEGETF